MRKFLCLCLAGTILAGGVLLSEQSDAWTIVGRSRSSMRRISAKGQAALHKEVQSEWRDTVSTLEPPKGNEAPVKTVSISKNGYTYAKDVYWDASTKTWSTQQPKTTTSSLSGGSTTTRSSGTGSTTTTTKTAPFDGFETVTETRTTRNPSESFMPVYKEYTVEVSADGEYTYYEVSKGGYTGEYTTIKSGSNEITSGVEPTKILSEKVEGTVYTRPNADYGYTMEGYNIYGDKAYDTYGREVPMDTVNRLHAQVESGGAGGTDARADGGIGSGDGDGGSKKPWDLTLKPETTEKPSDVLIDSPGSDGAGSSGNAGYYGIGDVQDPSIGSAVRFDGVEGTITDYNAETGLYDVKLDNGEVISGKIDGNNFQQTTGADGNPVGPAAYGLEEQPDGTITSTSDDPMAASRNTQEAEAEAKSQEAKQKGSEYVPLQTAMENNVIQYVVLILQALEGTKQEDATKKVTVEGAQKLQDSQGAPLSSWIPEGDTTLDGSNLTCASYSLAYLLENNPVDISLLETNGLDPSVTADKIKIQNRYNQLLQQYAVSAEIIAEGSNAISEEFYDRVKSLVDAIPTTTGTLGSMSVLNDSERYPYYELVRQVALSGVQLGLKGIKTLTDVGVGRFVDDGEDEEPPADPPVDPGADDDDDDGGSDNPPAEPPVDPSADDDDDDVPTTPVTPAPAPLRIVPHPRGSGIDDGLDDVSRSMVRGR